RLRRRELLRQALRHVHVVAGIAVGNRGHLTELGAAKAERVLLFLALRLGDHDQRAVAAHVSDQRETDAGVAGRALDDEAARLEYAALLRVEEDVQGGSVLHRAARVHELGLAEDRAARLLRSSAQPDQRRVPDRV